MYQELKFPQAWDLSLGPDDCATGFHLRFEDLTERNRKRKHGWDMTERNHDWGMCIGGADEPVPADFTVEFLVAGEDAKDSQIEPNGWLAQVHTQQARTCSSSAPQGGAPARARAGGAEAPFDSQNLLSDGTPSKTESPSAQVLEEGISLAKGEALNVVAFADVHGKWKEHDQTNGGLKLPDGQTGHVVIFGGDISQWPSAKEFDEFVKWFSGLNFKIKIMIAGNHDILLDESVPRVCSVSAIRSTCLEILFHTLIIAGRKHNRLVCAVCADCFSSWARFHHLYSFFSDPRLESVPSRLQSLRLDDGCGHFVCRRSRPILGPVQGEMFRRGRERAGNSVRLSTVFDHKSTARNILLGEFGGCDPCNLGRGDHEPDEEISPHLRRSAHGRVSSHCVQCST